MENMSNRLNEMRKALLDLLQLHAKFYEDPLSSLSRARQTQLLAISGLVILIALQFVVLDSLEVAGVGMKLQEFRDYTWRFVVGITIAYSFISFLFAFERDWARLNSTVGQEQKMKVADLRELASKVLSKWSNELAVAVTDFQKQNTSFYNEVLKRREEIHKNHLLLIDDVIDEKERKELSDKIRKQEAQLERIEKAQQKFVSKHGGRVVESQEVQILHAVLNDVDNSLNKAKRSLKIFLALEVLLPLIVSLIAVFLTFS